MKNSTIKQKTGICPECINGKSVPLTSGKCNNHYWQSKRKPLKKSATKIRPISKKRAAQERVYSKQRIEKLEKDPICQFPGCEAPATEVHHPAGRIGELLTKSELFVSLCHPHHVHVELNPIEAKELGLSFNRL